MNGRNPAGNGQQAGSSNPASTSSTSSSSLMAKFYQPMNAPFVPPTPTPPPPPLPPQQQQQYQQQAPIPITASVGDHQGYAPMQTLGIGANAAQLLANLATTPGYISEEAILEYSRRHQQQHTSQWQQPFSQLEPPSNQPQPYLAPTQYQQFQTQGYSQDFNRVQPSIQQSHDSRVSNDPNAAIGALLNELHQTGATASSATASIATSTPSYPLYASIPPPQSQPQPLVPPPDIPSQSQSIQSEHRSPCASSAIQQQQPSQEQSGDDFSSGKITPQLLKKLAALAESDVQSGSTLLNEIKRLRSRQTKTERSLYEDREELLNKQKRDFVKLQASEIMGVNVENEMQRTKSVHREELKRFDQRVVRAMDKEITLVQESLAQAGVPLMFSTQDPGKIASQIRVLRLLEDMLQT